MEEVLPNPTAGKSIEAYIRSEGGQTSLSFFKTFKLKSQKRASS
jgi:hypothetical protein